MLRQVACTMVVAISIGPWFNFFASHSFLASGMPFPIVSRIVVNVSGPHVPANSVRMQNFVCTAM